MKLRWIAILIALPILLLVGAGIYYYVQASAIYSPGGPVISLLPGAGSGSQFAHVVIIVEENKTGTNILGNTAAPYINQLANKYAYASNYSAITHPSLPNYIALTSATTAGISSDCNPPSGSCQAAVTNIADELEKAHKSWKAYEESMPSPCYTLNSGDYAVKHNPFVYYPSVYTDAKRCSAHDVPFSQLKSDLASTSSLPDYSFITPNLCSDMHNCSVQTGDNWLAQEVPAILRSPAFTSQKSLLVITWDEGTIFSNNVLTIFAGSAAKNGYVSATAYSHFALLRTIERNWHLTPLTQNDASSPAMADMLRY